MKAAAIDPKQVSASPAYVIRCPLLITNDRSSVVKFKGIV